MKAPKFFWEPLHPVSLILWPLSLLFGAVAAVRRLAYRSGIFKSFCLSVPVIVVGNLSVGGTGKTPLVIWAAKRLKELDLNPGVIVRGYGGTAEHWPQQVRPDSDTDTVGDEAVLIARRAECPVAAGPDRVEAAAGLIRQHGCRVILSDDGLQHYALDRNLEIAVIDGSRRLGNGLLLPAGPLREGAWRLKKVDLVIINGQGNPGEFSARMHGTQAVNMVTGERRKLRTFKATEVHAVAGIGNPDRFFDMLERNMLKPVRHAFADHHGFSAADLAFCDDHPVLMTEKDAVKCEIFADSRFWMVPVDVQPEAEFVQEFTRLAQELVDGQEAAGHPGMSDL